MSQPPVLWNPFSSDYKILPDCSTKFAAPFQSCSETAYGFGYDSRNDDYKVVRVVEFRHEFTRRWMASETKIYGLKSNSWKRTEDFPYPLPFLRGDWLVHVNGALHTLVKDPDEMDPAIIMAFNVETEKHYRLMMPPGMEIWDYDVNYGMIEGINLVMIEGCLSVVCTNRYRVVIWVMKEYGVKESWVKLLTISPPSIERNDFVKPLVYSRNGDKVLLNCGDKRLLWYDLREKTVDEVSVEGLPCVLYAEVCVESLVSLNGRDEVKKLGQMKEKETEKEKKKEKIRKKRDDFLSEGFKLVL